MSTSHSRSPSTARLLTWAQVARKPPAPRYHRSGAVRQRPSHRNEPACGGCESSTSAAWVSVHAPSSTDKQPAHKETLGFEGLLIKKYGSRPELAARWPPSAKTGTWPANAVSRMRPPAAYCQDETDDLPRTPSTSRYNQGRVFGSLHPRTRQYRRTGLSPSRASQSPRCHQGRQSCT